MIKDESSRGKGGKQVPGITIDGASSEAITNIVGAGGDNIIIEDAEGEETLLKKKKNPASVRADSKVIKKPISREPNAANKSRLSLNSRGIKVAGNRARNTISQLKTYDNAGDHSQTLKMPFHRRLNILQITDSLSNCSVYRSKHACRQSIDKIFVL